MNQKIINGIIIATFASAFFLVGLVTFWLNYPYKTIEIKTTPVHIVNKEVERGHMLNYQVDYCKYTKVSCEVQRAFVNGILYATPKVSATPKTGCGTTNVFLEIPRELPAGDYRLSISFHYQVNPIRKMVVNVESEPFTVLN